METRDKPGRANGKRASPTAKGLVTRHPSGWEMNVDEAQMMIQADITPPGDADPPPEHVGEHVAALAKVFSGLVETKLGAKVSMDQVTDLRERER